MRLGFLRKYTCLLLLFVILLFVSTVSAQGLTAETSPPALARIGIDQKLDAQLPLDLQFRDESGKTVRLGQYFGEKPVVLSLVYYECPMLCTLVLNGMVRTFRTLEFEVGKEYDVVTVSIDPKETPELAKAKKEQYVESYRRAGAKTGWHFLTGSESSIRQLADTVGFHYTYDEKTGQFGHASAIMVVTPTGRLAKYFYGVEFPPRDLRLGLVEASANKIGSPVDQILLYCLHYDPMTGKYGIVIKNVLRLTGLATVALLGTFIGLMLFKERARKRSEQAAGA